MPKCAPFATRFVVPRRWSYFISSVTCLALVWPAFFTMAAVDEAKGPAAMARGNTLCT